MASIRPTPPRGGEQISVSGGRLQVPPRPIIPYIEGDGIGPDIWAATQAVLDAAVNRVHGGRRSIQWMQILAGEKAREATDSYLPDETVEAIREFQVAIKGPLTTPVGGGFRSLNVALRQILLPILAEMEHTGVRIDSGHLAAMSRRMEQDLARIEESIHQEAGSQFNINSPKQLGEVLFQKLGIVPRRKTAKTRAYSTGQEVLEELAPDHPICARVLEFRSLAKLKGTYVDALPALVHPGTGRVHTSFNQTVAATGRLSSSDPNLQNIPVRTEVGREIRRAFIPADGWVLLIADYSQVELRILAHLTGDPVLIQAFRDGEDIHARTAAAIFGVSRDLVTDEMRRRAKAINFGILYGMGPQRLAREQGISMRDAQAFIQAYFEQFRAIKAYIEQTTSFAEKEGYVKTLLDRIRYFPELKSGDRVARQQALRAAVNTTLQGTAADLIKKAMIDIHGKLAGARLDSRMIIQVHDELVLEVPEGEIKKTASLVKEAMERVHELNVPLTVDLAWGPNWLEAKQG